jgi:hypothetical protein
MKMYLEWVTRYVNFFFSFLGILFLVQELWNWFEGDSLLRNAAAITVAIALFDFCKFLFKKLKQKKYQLN